MNWSDIKESAAVPPHICCICGNFEPSLLSSIRRLSFIPSFLWETQFTFSFANGAAGVDAHRCSCCFNSASIPFNSKVRSGGVIATAGTACCGGVASACTATGTAMVVKGTVGTVPTDLSLSLLPSCKVSWGTRSPPWFPVFSPSPTESVCCGGNAGGDAGEGCCDWASCSMAWEIFWHTKEYKTWKNEKHRF